jgi:hypothetical protein
MPLIHVAGAPAHMAGEKAGDLAARFASCAEKKKAARLNRAASDLE